MIYSKSILSFIDILGFSNIVKTKSCEDISSILHDLTSENYIHSDRYHDWLRYLSVKYDQINFSDSNIRILSFDSENEESIFASLSYEIIQIINIQRNMILDHKLPLRGAICYGDIHFSDSIMFGPNMVKAYELESKRANYSRILIDSELKERYSIYINKLTENHDRDFEQEVKFQTIIEGYKNISSSDDGLFFLDYLSYNPEKDIDWEIAPFEDFIKEHQLFIKQQTESDINEDLQIKYNLLSSYHNSCIDKNKKLFKDQTKAFNYKITKEYNKYYK